VQGVDPRFDRVVTPEAVPLELDVAGLGSRMIATLIDGAIQTFVFFVVLLIVSSQHLSESALAVTLAVTSFCLFWVYYFVFEGLWHGQTPGKRLQRLRVVRVDGHPMSGPQMFVRNLVRIVDFLPTYYAVGAITMILTRRSQRLGDLAAGTIVIREAKRFTPQPVTLSPPPPVPVTGSGIAVDVVGMSEAQYQLVRSFLERRSAMDAAARSHVAGQIATAIRPVARTLDWLTDETLLEAAALAYRSRFSRATNAGAPDRFH
jgi:uncharacterized RDD family membrane protein YckC